MVQIDTGLYLEALPYIAEALMRNGSMAHDIEQIYKKHEAHTTHYIETVPRTSVNDSSPAERLSGKFLSSTAWPWCCLHSRTRTLRHFWSKRSRQTIPSFFPWQKKPLPNCMVGSSKNVQAKKQRLPMRLHDWATIF